MKYAQNGQPGYWRQQGMGDFRSEAFSVMLELLELCELACQWCDERSVDRHPTAAADDDESPCDDNGDDSNDGVEDNAGQWRPGARGGVRLARGAQVAMSLLRGRLGEQQAEAACEWRQQMKAVAPMPRL